MPFIYKITNDINDKVYIGKTLETIEKRWKEHCKDYNRTSYNKRPLYNAMNKYGIEHFTISEIEECSEEVCCEREIFWIEYYNSYNEGYNATLGGDGKRYCDYEGVYELYKKGYTVKEIAKMTNYMSETCSKALKTFGITSEELKDKGRNACRKTIYQIDKNTNEVINIFSSITEAYNFLGKQFSGHIAEVCQGKRKTAYGYKWSYNI